MTVPGIFLVTGATGTVGREVVRLLAARGARVRAGTRRPDRFCAPYSGAAVPPPASVEAVALNYDRPDTLATALREVESVFLSTPLDERMAERVETLVARVREAGVRRVVRLSAFGAGDDAHTLLGRAHREAERAVEVSGIAYVHLRPNSFMQNYLTAFGPGIREQGTIRAPQGAGRVSLVDVRDVAAVAVEALRAQDHAGRAWELTGPEALSNHDVAAALARATGRDIRYLDVSEKAARDALADAGASPWLVDVILNLYALSRAGGAARISPHVRELLGREPGTFASFARDHAGALR